MSANGLRHKRTARESPGGQIAREVDYSPGLPSPGDPNDVRTNDSKVTLGEFREDYYFKLVTAESMVSYP